MFMLDSYLRWWFEWFLCDFLFTPFSTLEWFHMNLPFYHLYHHTLAHNKPLTYWYYSIWCSAVSVQRSPGLLYKHYHPHTIMDYLFIRDFLLLLTGQNFYIRTYSTGMKTLVGSQMKCSERFMCFTWSVIDSLQVFKLISLIFIL